MFGIKKFHPYIYGRKFQLLTDHKPLTTILGPKAGITSLAAARLQRWALLLSSYQYQIQYKSTQTHSNADGLSRLPVKTDQSFDSESMPTIFNIHQIAALPVTSKQIAAVVATSRPRSGETGQVLCPVPVIQEHACCSTSPSLAMA